MSLPAVPAATATVDLGAGVTVEVRALTVAEAVETRRRLETDEETGIAYAIGCATGTDPEEASLWVKDTPGGAVMDVFLTIRDLTGMDDDAPKSG